MACKALSDLAPAFPYRPNPSHHSAHSALWAQDLLATSPIPRGLAPSNLRVLGMFSTASGPFFLNLLFLHLFDSSHFTLNMNVSFDKKALLDPQARPAMCYQNSHCFFHSTYWLTTMYLCYYLMNTHLHTRAQLHEDSSLLFCLPH